MLDSEPQVEGSVGQLGRIHLILQPRPDELEPEPQLQVQARFVEYRNVAEAFVRARAKLPLAAWEQLEPGQCSASASLQPGPAPAPEGGDPEVSLIDAGELRVQLGARDLVVPLVLVPDILPWLSGVEYVHVDDRLPDLALEPDGSAPVSVSIDGTAEMGLETFTASMRLPVALELQAASTTADRLTIDWQPAGNDETNIVLELQAFAMSDGSLEPSGEEITCLVADSGRAALELDRLERAGLATSSTTSSAQRAELLRVVASRYESVTFDIGAFTGVEVIVELRDQRTLPLTTAFASEPDKPLGSDVVPSEPAVE